MTDSRKHIVGPTERREEIARIIDPAAWHNYPTAGPLYTPRQAESIAKADAILASDDEVVTSRPVCLPEGWVAVPREPTEAMLEAHNDVLGSTLKLAYARSSLSMNYNHALAYRAMIAAAPPLPEPTQDGSPQKTPASDGGRETKCYECGHELSGPYCPACNPADGGREMVRALD